MPRPHIMMIGGHSIPIDGGSDACLIETDEGCNLVVLWRAEVEGLINSPLPFGPGGSFVIDIDATLQPGVTVYDADDMDRMDAECSVIVYEEADGFERLRLEVFENAVRLEGVFWLGDELCTISVERFHFGENPWA